MLHVALRGAPISLDPADPRQPDSITSRNLTQLLFDTLVTLDDQGKPQPSLAASWQSEPSHQRWQFYLRHGVTFPDGSALTADVVAASLRTANPTWKVFPSADAVVVERDAPAPDLPVEVALPRNGVAKRDGGKLAGTGPFTVAQWIPGSKLVLTARDDYWAGRAYLDAIDIDLGQNPRAQMIALDLGKTQLVDVAAEQIRHVAAEGRRVTLSAPVELMALVYRREPKSPEEGRLRKALALSIDRGLINSVVLQGGGEPSGGLLPNWMTGYGYVFPVSMDAAAAREERTNIRQEAPWTLAYEGADPVARVIAERIALSAHDTSLAVQPTTASAADIRLVRVPLTSLDARVALGDLATAFDLPRPKFSSTSVDDLYAAESALLQSQRVIPLFHLRTAFGVHATVKNWSQTQEGSWRLPEVWLGPERP